MRMTAARLGKMLTTSVRLRSSLFKRSCGLLLRHRGHNEGGRESLGFDAITTEDGAAWTAFLRSLVARGLSGVLPWYGQVDGAGQGVSNWAQRCLAPRSS